MHPITDPARPLRKHYAGWLYILESLLQIVGRVRLTSKLTAAKADATAAEAERDMARMADELRKLPMVGVPYV